MVSQLVSFVSVFKIGDKPNKIKKNKKDRLKQLNECTRFIWHQKDGEQILVKAGDTEATSRRLQKMNPARAAP